MSLVARSGGRGVTTVLFVHGTGVRDLGHTASLEALRAGLAAVRPDVRVHGCGWGSVLGSYLRAGGVSVPDGPVEIPDTESAGADGTRARWALLYADPFAELALAALGERAGEAFLPGEQPPGDLLWARLAGLNGSERARAAWSAAGLAEDTEPALGLESALREVMSSPQARRAVAAADGDGARGPARLLARAMVAWAIGAAPQGPGAVAVKTRDALVDALVDELGGDGRGPTDAITSALVRSARTFERAFGSRWLVSRRGALTGRTLGFAGDILSYLVRGAAVRAYVADHARELPRPLVLLGHSLGGVVAFDLLASGVLGPVPAAGPSRPAAAPPQVDLLVTVGSQSSLLYELDALPSCPFGTGLPTDFPSWVNIYDPRDLLSFTCSEVFAGKVVDVRVDNGQPVSAAHSSYWVNPEFFSVLERWLPKCSNAGKNFD